MRADRCRGMMVTPRKEVTAETLPMPGASPSCPTLRSARAFGFVRETFALAWSIVTAITSRRPVRPLGDESEGFFVAEIDPGPSLVLTGGAGLYRVAWAFVLEPIDANRTRLLGRAGRDYDRPAVWLLLQLVWRPMHFAMERKQLPKLRGRSERAAPAPGKPSQERAERSKGGSDGS